MSDLTINTLPALSTTTVRVIQVYRVDYTIPTMASGASTNSTATVTGLTTNSVLALSPRLSGSSLAVGIQVSAWCSTINELQVGIVNNSGSTITGSTQSAYLLQFGF